MDKLKYYLPTDSSPFSGERKVPNIKVCIKDLSEECFYETSILGTSKEEYYKKLQYKCGVHVGAHYEVDKVDGFGDVADVHIVSNDFGSDVWLLENIVCDLDVDDG